jgi:hypothetical protein
VRTELRKLSDDRREFTCVFDRYGTVARYMGGVQRTLLFRDVTDCKTGQVVTDHIWFTERKTWVALGELHPGERLRFQARVKSYDAGYRGHREDAGIENPPRIDYKLAWPSQIKRVL